MSVEHFLQRACIAGRMRTVDVWVNLDQLAATMGSRAAHKPHQRSAALNRAIVVRLRETRKKVRK